ncbi:cysteine desulfurase family protein [Rapidithrix thailandica]|uniref:Cysteine desulfurase family protein n=1 Tax=Rapidithrix thailandica TaxID=413964 RepID=A0AAW9S2E1_9BACT
MRVYFDNAATTPMDKEVIETITSFMQEHFGNPSSTHGFGRDAKVPLERARKQIAQYFQVSPFEIYFTSGGTEADNIAIHGAVKNLGVKTIITSPLEHHAVLHTVEQMQKQYDVQLKYVDNDAQGNLDYAQLEKYLTESKDVLVCLMHGNNEIGNLNDIEKIGQLCEQYGAYFHTDAVQTVGHFPLNLQKVKAHFMAGAAHKFHGPKGAGFLFVRKDVKIEALIHGGGQERSMRSGTENVPGIIGMAKALEIAHTHMDADQAHIQALKQHMVKHLTEVLPEVAFNGLSASAEDSLYTVLNVRLPKTAAADMLLFNLDLEGVAASGGSACSSGASVGSHVIQHLGVPEGSTSVRFSFSKFNTLEEVDYAVEVLKKILGST